MKTHALSNSCLISLALFGVVALALLLLTLAGALPVNAAMQSLWPDAITNPQQAAILGGQNLLILQEISHSIYLPAMIR